MKKSPLKKVSDKRRRQLAVYAKLKAIYLVIHPYCQYEELGTWRAIEYPVPCPRRATQIHHKKGREGELLNQPKFYLAVCDYHGGSYIHDRSGDSYDRGFMLLRK